MNRKIDPRKAVVGFDFDFTLGQFKRDRALATIVSSVSDLPPLVGVDVRDFLETRVQRLIAGEAALIEEVRRMFNRHVVQRRDAKLEESTWSLFARLCMLLSERGVRPEEYYKLLVNTEDLFWKVVQEDSCLFDDTGHVLQWLHSVPVPMFVLTSSDARLLYEESSNRVLYSLQHSIAMKHQRIRLSGLQDYPLIDQVIPSDPFSKESLTAWEKLVFPRFLDRQDREHWVFVGDAGYDMEGALLAKVGTRIFIHRHGNGVPPEATHDVTSLTGLQRLLKELLSTESMSISV